MNGLIRLDRITSIRIVEKEDRVFLVFQDGRRNLGYTMPSLEKAKEHLDFIMRKQPTYYRVNGVVESMTTKLHKEIQANENLELAGTQI